MNLIRSAINRPIAVIAAVIMVILLGLVALQGIPIQLTPDIRKPILTINTLWLGAAPAEVEREITNRQEEVLKGIEGLSRMTSSSRDSESEIVLEFKVGQNMDRGLLLVANRLDRVADYPEEADEPFISTAGAEDQAIAWFILKPLEGNKRDIHTYGDYIEDVIKDRIERVPGVARSNIFGGTEREMRVTIDPKKMASYGLTISDIALAIRENNHSISAGDINEGKRRYVVRTDSELNSVDRVSNIVLLSASEISLGAIKRVTMGDIAEITYGFKKPTAQIRALGVPSIAINAIRETGANVIETMSGIKEAVKELNDIRLPEAGLKLDQVYDETVYINSSINLVEQNIYIGGTLAALVLLLFLRSIGATLIISVAIPISVIGSFVAMAALGRSINVVSLAGFAFAVGMVVDAAIVVLENIYRHKQKGISRFEAAYKGARQVWGAIFVSSLTTVLVFLPLLIMELEAGQLFRDIGVAISVAVVLSLVVAITLIPAMASRILGLRMRLGPPSRGVPTYSAASDENQKPIRIAIPIIDESARVFVNNIVRFTEWVVRNRIRSLAVVILICGCSLAIAWTLLPKLDYLPEGNRNLIFGVLMPPPGYNLETTSEIAKRVENSVKPLWQTENDSDYGDHETPRMENFFFITLRTQAFVGAVSTDPSRVSELIEPLRRPVFQEPGTFGFISQAGLFSRVVGGGRKIDINISGPNLQEVLNVALQATIKIFSAMPMQAGNQFRPRPGLQLGAPEVRLEPNPMQLSDSGITAGEFGLTIDAFNDGVRVDEITVDGKRMDLMLMGNEESILKTQDINNLPIVTQDGTIVPASSLAKIIVTSGPTEIRHVERERTVTLEIRPSPGMPLEEATETIQERVIKPLSGGLPEGIKMRVSGTADELTKTFDEMIVNLCLALIIVYLIMAVLFESFIYPFIIMLSVPAAAAGGVLGLTIVNEYTTTPFDMLTLLGFVILVGIVVNNAILLVHQTLHHIRIDGLAPQAAIVEATRNRIRPIFMSTLTSVFGMLPLVLFPGAGSELYRGLGSVIVGGLALSSFITLFVVPPMLMVLTRPRKKYQTELMKE
tara:strand:- start:33598 stop:36813 length:3216 start_codon:yes stop_codon:yes gene_type:complete